MKRYYVLSLSLILVAVLILWIGPLNLLKEIGSANWLLLLLAVIIHLLGVGLRAFRWGFIINKPWDFKNNFVVKTIGLFAGNFSPVRSAGEPVTALAGKKINEIEVSEGLSAGLTERFFDLVIVGIFLIASSFLIPKIRFLSIIGAILSLGMVALIYVVNWRENSSIMIYKKIHPFLEKLPIKAEVIDNFYNKAIKGLQGMVEYTRSFTSFKNMSIMIFLSISCWLIECLRLLVVFYAFDVEISLVSVIIIFLLANFIGVVSALPGGIGSIELSMTGLFVLFGVSGDLAGIIALTDRLLSFWIVSFLGLIFSSFYAHEILDEIKKYTLDSKGMKKS